MANRPRTSFKEPSLLRRKLECTFPKTEPRKRSKDAEGIPLSSKATSKPQMSRLRSRCGISTPGGMANPDVCDRRLTRSASKRWLKAYVSNSTKQEETHLSQADDIVMRPPQVPSHQMLPRSTCTGIITRQKYRNLCTSENVGDHLVEMNKMSQNFYKRLSFDQASNTSDYGTASEHSRKCSVASGGMSPISDSGDSCHCGSVSGIESLGTVSGDSSPQHVGTSETGWDCERLEPGVGTWDTACREAESNIVQLGDLSNGPQVMVHQADDVYAFIPAINRSGYTGSFAVSLKSGGDDHFYRPSVCSSMRVHHVSPVVSMEPHGVQFHEAFPVMLVVPLNTEPQNDEWLSCLFSNTPADSPPCWERLPRKDYTYRNGCLVITTNHFSLFTVILEEPYPEVMKRIRRRAGGCLRLDEVPGVEVEFPRGCLDRDVDAYLRVLYDHEPMLDSKTEPAKLRNALASPVIMLGPHGHNFSTSRHPVRVKLPVPHYHEIQNRFGHGLGLTVWQSSTQEGEPTHWQRLESARLELEPAVPGLSTVVVSFTVHHFSFFKVVWDLLSSSLQEAKMGMSYFYPYVSFSMMCQAFMEESKGDTRFGLEVICYRSDKRLPEQTNYSHRVGASLKPKLLRPGRILVRLRSQMFEADVEAGEDETMEKEEPDFRGRDFEKQYACRFKPDGNVESGTFGKVIVERIAVGRNDPLFEFNLHKSGLEHEVSQPMGSERWTAFAMKELASTLQITEGSNWKRFAQHIGFTKSEIKSKFQYSPDPFLSMMNLYGSRGGTPEEFMQALYAVSRELRLNMGGMSGSHSHSDGGSSARSSNGSRGSGSRDSGSRGSKGSGRFGGLWGFRPWAQVNNDSDPESVPGEAKQVAKKRSRSSSEKKENSGGSSGTKRRKFSDVSETVSSGSEGGDDDSDKEAEKSNNKHINNRVRLNDRDMWKISKGIARKDWRFLGRTLGIEERVLVDLEHQYQPVGFRECAYQMLLEWKGRKPRQCTFGSLYSALLRENMVEIAKHMVKILPEEVDARERDLTDGV